MAGEASYSEKYLLLAILLDTTISGMKLTSDITLFRKLESLKAPNEEILWAARANPKAKTARRIMNTMALILLIIAIFYISRQIAKFIPVLFSKFSTLALLLLLPFIDKIIESILLLFQELYRAMVKFQLGFINKPITAYGFSDKRIFMFHGPSISDLSALSLEDIVDIEVRQDLLSRFYNTGTIKFYQGQTRQGFGNHIVKIYLDWFYVTAPRELHKQLLNTMLATKHRQARTFSSDASTEKQTSSKLRPISDYVLKEELITDAENNHKYNKNTVSPSKSLAKEEFYKFESAKEYLVNNKKRLKEEEDYSKEFEAVLEANEAKQLETSDREH